MGDGLMVVGSFGEIVFEVSRARARSFEGLSWESGARLASTEIIGREPVVEFLGPDGQSISFSMQFNAALGVDPEAELTRLQAMMANGKAGTFVLGGKPIGGSGAKWLIEKVAATYSNALGRNAQPALITADVTLRKYVRI